MVNQWGNPGGPSGEQNWQPGVPPAHPTGPPVFGAAPFQVPGWGQQPAPGHPPQFPPPQHPKGKRGKVIALGIGVVLVVLVVVVGVITVWPSGEDPEDNVDTTAGRAEVAAEARPSTPLKAPSLSAAPHPLWTYPGEDGGLPHVLGGDVQTVLVNTENNVLVALDAATGTPRWQQRLPGDVQYCVVGTSGATAACVVRNRKAAVILDMNTGATKVTVPDLDMTDAYAGSGLLAVVDNRKSITVFDGSGQQLWTKPLEKGSIEPFLDQRIIAFRGGTETTFYDAETGRQKFSLDSYVDDLLVTGRGIAMSVRAGSRSWFSRDFPLQRIDFYSFSGNKAWSIPAKRGYRLPSAGWKFSFAKSVQNSNSGVALPIVYSETQRDIAAVDDKTGEILWTQSIPVGEHELVYLGGAGNLCIINYKGSAGDTVQVRDCTAADGFAFTDSQLGDNDQLVIADDSHVVFTGSLNLVAYDTATGGQSWNLSKAGIVTWVGDGLYAASGGGGVTRLG